MFGLFKSEPFRDPELGELRRSGGHWKGSITLPPGGTFRLALAGGRDAPDSTALQLSKELPGRFQALTPAIERGFFEHYLPYKEAVDAGEETDDQCPVITSADAVWPHVKPAHVLIEPLSGEWRVELAFETEWDIEHTVAAIFHNWEMVEFNGSVRGQ